MSVDESSTAVELRLTRSSSTLTVGSDVYVAVERVKVSVNVNVDDERVNSIALAGARPAR